MGDFETRRIRLGPVTQQYVDSCLWLVGQARAAQGEARAALEEAARLSHAAVQLPGDAVEERLRAGLGVERALGRAAARVLEAEVLMQDAAAYLRHMNGNAENGRRLVEGKVSPTRDGVNGNGARAR